MFYFKIIIKIFIVDIYFINKYNFIILILSFYLFFLQRTKSVFAGDMMEDCDGYEEISSITSRPSALELITPCTSGHGQHRSLWCEVPEVKNSGIIGKGLIVF